MKIITDAVTSRHGGDGTTAPPTANGRHGWAKRGPPEELFLRLLAYPWYDHHKTSDLQRVWLDHGTVEILK